MNNKKEILTAKVTYATISDIHEPVGLNGGDENITRWDLDIPKVRTAYEELITSIKVGGFLAGTVAVQLPEDVTLFNIDYKKGHWIAIDVNGRLRALKDIVETGYLLNPDTDIEGQVPIVDVTHLVITDDTFINEDIIEKLWQTIVKLNTGQLPWTDYDFISSGSRAITNTEQIVIWKYLSENMKTYHPDLSNKVVLAAIIKELTDSMKRKYKIDFNMNYKRYSDIILKRLLEIRKAHGSSDAKAPFLRALANYFRRASHNQSFKGAEYDREGKRILSTEKECFSFAGKIYEDEHFFEFKRGLDYISQCFENVIPPQDGFAGTESAALKQIHNNTLRFQNKYDRKGQ